MTFRTNLPCRVGDRQRRLGRRQRMGRGRVDIRAKRWVVAQTQRRLETLLVVDSAAPIERLAFVLVEGEKDL